MFVVPLTYLSAVDRSRLEQLTAIIENPRLSKTDRETASVEREQIEGRRKPLHETNFEEAQDFRMFLYGKFRRLASLGATPQAFQFQQFIGRIEQHMQALQIESAKKAIEDEKAKASLGKELRNNVTGKTRRGSVSAKQDRSPWAIPVDDDD